MRKKYTRAVTGQHWSVAIYIMLCDNKRTQRTITTDKGKCHVDGKRVTEGGLTSLVIDVAELDTHIPQRKGGRVKE